jgi:predicted GH43/DUF377 family glycosyl hydrolase
MELITRYKNNPILGPNKEMEWEKEAAFNGCPVQHKGSVHLFYRAVSGDKDHAGVRLKLSTIGHAVSHDGLNFKKQKQLLTPEFDWERYGCEDPRVTKYKNNFYLFYTALGGYPFCSSNIKVAVAISKDLKKFTKKQVTTFNAKAMALFPEDVSGKMTAILTVNTDNPPAKIAIAQFDKPEDLTSNDYWDAWYANRAEHTVPLQRHPYDHVEVGAPPIKTKQGWLLIYSYIHNYFGGQAKFCIEAVLLDLKDPRKIIGRMKNPLLTPEAEYERNGMVQNIAFPSGAYIKNGQVYVYYGAADTTCCVAVGYLDDLLKSMIPVEKLQRFKGNPVLTPNDDDVAWRSKAVFNPAAIVANGKVHILYRAMSNDWTSVLGYAESKDGYGITDVEAEPAYVPRIRNEQKLSNGNSGCEDPRLSVIGKSVYMLYTAYNGKELPHVALTSIPLDNFVKRKWDWKAPVIISPENVDDKDAAIFPGKIGGRYVFIHRLGKEIWIDHKSKIEEAEVNRLQGKILMAPRPGKWDDDKIGLSAPPILTSAGWLLLYHGICKKDLQYRVGAALLKKEDPTVILGRTEEPLLEPEMLYETEGIVKNVVFPCGAVVVKGELIVYYGGADTVLGVASLDLKRLIAFLKKSN